MDKENNSTDELPVRFPGALGLKDLITLVSVAVSMTIAWGVFGTRVTIVEQRMATHEEAQTKTDARLDALERLRINTDQRIRENEFAIDRLYEYSGKPPPVRRTPQ